MFLSQYYWSVGISLVVWSCCATATLVEKPQNTFASEGHRVQLNCSTSDLTTPISWQYIPGAEGDLPKDVFLGGRLVNDYVRFQMYVNRAEGIYNLVIPSPEQRDAGTYRCRDQDGAGEHVDVILNVTKSTRLHIEPEHGEVQVGSSVQLNCTTYYKTEPVNWQYIPHGKNQTLNVYIGGQFVNAYTSGYEAHMDNKTGTNSLIITAVQLGDGGSYRCIEKEGRGQHNDSELTVIDTVECRVFPVDSCGTSPVNMTLECKVIFSGNLAPLIQWVTANGVVKNEEVVTTNHSDSVISILMKEIDNLNLALEYTCRAAMLKASCKLNTLAHCQTEAYDSGTQSSVIDSTEPNLNLLWLLLLLLLIPLIIAVRFCCRRIRGQQRQQRTEQKDPLRRGTSE